MNWRRVSARPRRGGPRAVAAALALLALAAAPAFAQTDGASRVTLKVWDYPRWTATPDSVDRFHWMRAQLAAFERAHPHVRVDFTRLSWDYGADKVRVAVLAGVGPDLIAGAPMTEFIARGLVEPVDDSMTTDDRADYAPAALDAFQWRGRTWGWPWYQTGSVVLLNRALFADAGVPVPADGRWTHAEFDAALERLSRAEGERYGLGFSAKAGLAIWPWLFPRDAAVFVDDRASLNAPGVATGLGRLHGYLERRWALPGSGGLPAGPVWEAFAYQQRVAVAPFGVWAIPALRERADFPFAVAHYPADTPGGASTFVAASGWMVLRHGDESRRAAAMALARQLTSAEAQRDLRAYGVFPTRNSAGDLYADDPDMQRAAEVLFEGRPVPLHPRWPRVEAAVASAAQRVLTGEAPVQTALAEAEDQVGRTAEVGSVGSADAPRRRTRGGTIGAGVGMVLCVVFVCAGGRDHARRFALFAAPAMIVLAAVMLWPLVWSVALSFATFDVATGWFGQWVGLDHYRSLWGDATFRTSVLNTLVYTGVVVPGQVVIALVLASAIAPLGARTRAWFRGAFYLPGVTSVVVLSVVWRWMFDEQAGALNGLLGFWGVGAVRWLSDPDVALWSIVLMTLARPPGGPMLIYLAALDAVPAHLTDAAALDGAGRLNRWWRITVPLVAPTTVFLFVTGTVGAFQVFAQVYMLTDGGPGTATTVWVHQIYTTAMRDFAFGRASAMAVVLAVVLAAAAYASSRRRRPAVQY